MAEKSSRRALIAALAIVEFLGGLGVASLIVRRPPEALPAAAGGGRPVITVEFSLLDEAARPVRWSEMSHRRQLVFFGFTHCPEVCPTTLTNASQALDALGAEAGDLRVVFITVDSERDTPAVVGAYARNFGPRVVGFTGDVAGIAAAAAAFGVFYEKMPPMADGDYMVNHTATLFLLGPGDEILEIMPFGATAADIAAAVRRHP